jgi:hypothetical protein
MKYESMSIRKAIQLISERDLLLPHIQRPFVWKQDRTHNQVQRFFDSIMRAYPFGTLLFWITKDDIRVRRFVEYYHDDMDMGDLYIKSNELKNKKKTLILDGQQRLQALYLALKGTYNDMELYFDIFSGTELFFEGQEEFKYHFDYIKKDKIDGLNKNGQHHQYWLLFKDIVLSNENTTEIKKRILSEISKMRSVSNEDESIVDENISKIKNLFNEHELIYYYPIDSTIGKGIDYEEILEIFIRTNSGGTILKKSDLMFSLIKLDWEEAEEEFEKLLKSLNKPELFEFDKDFVLKTALVIMGRRAKYEVNKFKGAEGDKNLSFLKNNWTKIKTSFGWMRDFLKYARIESDEALPGYNALIPILYYAYLHDTKIYSAKVKYNIQTWLYKVLLNGNFSGQSDQIIDACAEIIKKESRADYFPYIEIEEVIKNKYGRRTDVNENILDANIYLILNMLYLFNKKVVNYQPILIGNNPEIDHIFPKSVMISKKYDLEKSKVNNIGNYMFLEKNINIEKSDKLPGEYFPAAINQQDDFLRRNAIPDNKRLEKPENFIEFIIERRKLIFSIVQQCLIYQNGGQQKGQLRKISKDNREWDKEEIGEFLDEAKVGKPLRYCLIELLTRADGEADYYDLKVKLEKMIHKEINYYQFGGILGGIGKASKKRDKEMLVEYASEGQNLYIPIKYRKIIADYFSA